MKTIFVVALFLSGFALASFAQTTDTTATDTNTNSDPTTSISSLKQEFGRMRPTSKPTHRYVEFFQLPRNWIYPDFGYLDFGNGRYQENFDRRWSDAVPQR